MKLRITIAGNIYEADVEVLDDETNAPEFLSPAAVPAAYASTPDDPAAKTPRTADQDPAEKVCRSPVNGVVIRVDVEPGQAVEANQLVIVLEAMKMETQVMAPCAGIVQKIHVAPGNSVKASQVLVELD